MPYPTTYAEELTPMPFTQLDELGIEAMHRIQDAGYVVTAGVRPADVADITEIAHQEGVREYCPKDLTRRFGDEAMMEQWLTKGGGRGMFLLREAASMAIRGYGWTGAEKCPQLPDCTTTFAIRLDERVGGRGLAVPFTAAIVSGSMALYGARKIGLETWGSNTGAVKTYVRNEAELVTTKDDWRPTIHSGPGVVDGQRQDVRLFMKFPRTFEQE